MTTAGKPQTAGDTLNDVKAARDELADALRAVGITLPSLRLDVASCSGPAAYALIELGRCNVQTARALAAALSGPTTEAER
ncbi:hypothetical protein [Streptomyces sp. H27-C3]|uniref:hypothetical protein n=1 Tax=Streptomyces sp. H27-C3 TaxID=3046305 RepID=UPI0024B9D0F4|nr:hypothetical protein [Streptomyces sp. H27-C3]MDJ0461983.1 hypothetical protein [Streptomyces sp. H27-C3]